MALISYLTRIRFDLGALAAIGEEMAGLDMNRPLVVTDPGIEANGLLARLLDALPHRKHATVFAETPQNPTEPAVRAALERFQRNGCDGVIGFGGGSSLDLAKGVRLLAGHDGPLAQYTLVEGGAARITAHMPPMIAVPTTAGTGSEVGRGAVLILEDGRKLGVISPHLIPSVALCDPDLTLGLPPYLTAATGMDAVAHAIETYLAPAINPPADAIALDALARLSAHIERATANGGDREARWHMMMGAMMAAMAFQKGLGAVHAMSHPLGALPGLTLHHGTLNAVVLPAVLRFNAGQVGMKMDMIGAAMGLGEGADAAAEVARLNARLGLPSGLAEMGVRTEQIPALAQAAIGDHCSATNPRPADRDAYVALFQEAMG